MAKMKKTDSDLLFGYIDINHNSGDRYTFYPKCFISILEYTHHKSAVPRARVAYHSPDLSLEFYIAREKITRPIIIKSVCPFWYDGINIKVRATFFKHPDDKFCEADTPYIIESINANGFNLDTVSELAEFTGTDEKKMREILLDNLLDYVDELPF